MSTFQTPGGSKKNSSEFEFTPIGVLQATTQPEGEQNGTQKGNRRTFHDVAEDGELSRQNYHSHTSSLQEKTSYYRTNEFSKRLKLDNPPTSASQSINHVDASTGLFEEEPEGDDDFEDDNSIIYDPTLTNSKINSASSQTKVNTVTENNEDNERGSKEGTQYSNPVRGQTEKEHALEVENNNLQIKLNTLLRYTQFDDRERIMALIEENTDLKSKLMDAFKKVDSYKEELSSKNENSKRSANNKQELEQIKVAFQKELEQAKDLLRKDMQQEHSLAIAKLQAEKNALESQTADMSKTIHSLRDDLEHVKHSSAMSLDSNDQKYKDLENQLSEQKSYNEQSDKTIQRLQSELQKQKQQNSQSAQNLNNEFKRKLALKEKEVDSLQKQISELQKGLKSSTESSNLLRSSKKNEIEHLQKTLSEHKKALQGSKDEIERLLLTSQNQESHYKGLVDSLNNKVNVLTEDAKRIDAIRLSEKHALNHQHELDITNIHDLENNVKQLKVEVSNLNTDLETKNKTIKGLEAIIEENEVNNDIKEKVESLQRAITESNNALEKSKEQHISVEENLKAQILELEERVRSLKSQSVAKAELHQKALSDLTQTNERQLAALKTSYEKTEQLLQKQHKKQLTELERLHEQTYKELENNHMNDHEKIFEIRKEHAQKLQSLTLSLTNLQQEKSEVESRLVASYAKATELQKRIATLKKEKEELADDCQTLQSEYNALAEKASQAGEVLEKERELTNLNQKFAQVKNNYEVLENKYANVKEKSFLSEKQLESINNKHRKLLKSFTQEFEQKIETLRFENEQLNEEIIQMRRNGNGGKYSYSNLQPADTQQELVRLIERLKCQVEYFKTKYHREIYHTNDLHVLNEYLNTVLRATTQKMREDYAKAAAEMGKTANTASDSSFVNFDTYHDGFTSKPFGRNNGYASKPTPPTPMFEDTKYDYTSNILFPQNNYARQKLLRKKFKSAGLAVLACVRLRMMTQQSQKERRKLLNLKVRFQDDVVSW
ncbi:hypothetical protein ACO0QE_004545 [Hanseniaspora vineae]